jgi:hypothetical protein
MTTVLPDLERDLVQAAARHAASRERGSLRRAARWVGRRSRPARLLFGLAVVSAAAASAATLVGSSSLPLSGAIRSHERYTITIAPWLDAGVAGWCVADRVSNSSRSFLEGNATCSTTARVGSPLVLTSYGGPVATVITAAGVAAVRVAHGPTILTRADSHLPSGFRAAVFRTRRSYFSGGGPLSLTALDAHGRRIPGGVSAMSSLPTLVWARPGEGAEVSGALPTFPHHGAPAAHAAPQRGCVTAAKAGSGLVAIGGVDVTQIVADRVLSGRAFLDCADTLYLGEGTTAKVSVLLDAKHPGARPEALPDSRPVAGAAGFYTVATPLSIPDTWTATARRVGDAWLVASSAVLTTKVAGGYTVSSPPITRAQEIQMLRALTIGAIHLHAQRHA